MITPNEYFDEIFCINLDKSTDRWVDIQKKFIREEIFVTRIEGVDKNEGWMKQAFLGHQKSTQTSITKLGRFAVWKAFSKVFDYVIENQEIERFLIFEDDILFHKNFKSMFDESIRKIPQNWEMWYLGVTQLKWTDLEKDKIDMFYNSNKFTYGCFAVAMTRKFLEDYYPIYKQGLFNNDHFFAKVIDKQNVYASYPPLIGHQYSYSLNADYLITEKLVESKLPYFKYDLNIYI
jgi:GR25 family glycosyltransferase involved in LPS biosynthesis